MNPNCKTQVIAAIEAQAGDRKRNVLVQAVSLLRQRKLDDVVKSLNNLLACNKVRSRQLTHLPCSAAEHACAVKETLLVVTSLVSTRPSFGCFGGTCCGNLCLPIDGPVTDPERVACRVHAVPLSFMSDSSKLAALIWQFDASSG